MERSRRTAHNGTFQLEITRGEPLLVSHVHYQSRRIAHKDLRGVDTLTIYLSRNTQRQANILQATTTETVYESEFEAVGDFNFLGDTLVVLAFMEMRPKAAGTEVRLYHNTITMFRFGKVVSRTVVPDHALSLHKDPLGRLYLRGSGYVYRIHNRRDGVKLEELDADLFDTQVRPITALGKNRSFFASQLLPVPEVRHQLVWPIEDRVKTIRTIRNQEYFDNILPDNKMMNAWQQEVAKELAEKYDMEERLFAPMVRQPWRDRDYEFPHSPAFGDTARIFIFDHLHGYIYSHSAEGAPLDSVMMYHHRFDGEKYVGMIQDEVTRRCYALHEKAGAVYLREINPFTGAARWPIKLRQPLPRTVKAYEGHIYYVYKLPGSKELARLVREKIPY